MFSIVMTQLFLNKISIYYLNYIHKMLYQYSETASSTHLEKNLRFKVNKTKPTMSLQNESSIESVMVFLKSLFALLQRVLET